VLKLFTHTAFLIVSIVSIRTKNYKKFPYFVKEYDKFKKSIYFAASVSLDEMF